MNTYMPEEIERWTRLMAEIEGWTDIRPYNSEDRPCGCAETNSPDDYGWGEDQDTPLIGKPPDEESNTYHLPRYCWDLNALARVAMKICETEEGHDILDESLLHKYRMSFLWGAGQGYAWQACLFAEELFVLYGKVLDKLRRSNDNLS